jgi:hypothetical protein
VIAGRVLAAITAFAGGVAFYFTIIGVFELPAACISLGLFVGLAITAWRFEPQIGPGGKT